MGYGKVEKLMEESGALKIMGVLAVGAMAVGIHGMFSTVSAINDRPKPLIKKAGIDEIIQKIEEQNGVVTVVLTEEQLRIVKDTFNQRPDLLERLQQTISGQRTNQR